MKDRRSSQQDTIVRLIAAHHAKGILENKKYCHFQLKSITVPPMEGSVTGDILFKATFSFHKITTQKTLKCLPYILISHFT